MLSAFEKNGRRRRQRHQPRLAVVGVKGTGAANAFLCRCGGQAHVHTNFHRNDTQHKLQFPTQAGLIKFQRVVRKRCSGRLLPTENSTVFCPNLLELVNSLLGKPCGD